MVKVLPNSSFIDKVSSALRSKTAFSFMFVLILVAGFMVTLKQFYTVQNTKPEAAGTGTSPCQFQTADSGVNIAFCDTFDAPAGTGNRSGQLNGTIWGVSRVTGDMNLDSGHAAPWVKATLDGCNGSQAAQPDGTDIIICNGQLREATNDNATGAFDAGGVIALTMYPKQPFDFAGRTGTIAFDVSDDNNGTHATWPEVWLTDKPIPGPFVHFGNWDNPQNGFGIRFAGSYYPGNGSGSCPDDGTHRVGVSSLAVFRNFVADDNDISPATFTATELGCVHAASGPNSPLNHVEIRVSQNAIDVYMSDPGSTLLKHVERFDNVNLTLSRGLVWIEDAHYNADKGPSPSQRNHTYTWDNVGFDGPATYRDLSYDVLDSLTPCHDGTLCLGWQSLGASQPTSVSTLPMSSTDISAAVTQRLMFNAYFFDQPSVFSFTINGHPYTAPWPFPYSETYGEGTFSFDINKADLVNGSQAIKIWADQSMIVSNVNIVLVNVGPVGSGGGTVAPQNTPTTSPNTPTPTPIAPTPTPLPSGSTIKMGETNILTEADNGNADLLVAQKATLSQTATLQSVSFYITNAAGSLRLGVYDATGPSGGPGQKVGETGSFTPTTGWNTVNILSPVTLPAGTYWLAYLPSDNNLAFVKNSNGTGGKFYSFPYAALPQTFSTTPNSTASDWSFYATLVVSGTLTPTATPTPTPVPPTPVPSNDTTSPSVTVTYPANGTVFTRNTKITITASATDNVGVTKVEFYVNGSLTCTDTTASYACPWKIPGKAKTFYTLSAKAYDAAGNSAISAVNITTN